MHFLLENVQENTLVPQQSFLAFNNILECLILGVLNVALIFAKVF